MPHVQFVRSRVLAAARPGLPVAVLWAGAAVVIPTLIRLCLDGVVSGVPFLTYVPFVAAAAMFLGWRSAMIVTALSTLAGASLFVDTRFELFESTSEVMSALVFVIAASALTFGIETLRTAARTGDLDHRWSYPAQATARPVSPPLSKGHGLLLAAALSLALWGGVIWAVMRLFRP